MSICAIEKGRTKHSVKESEREEDVMEMFNLKCIQKPHKINERKHISPHVSSEIVYNEERIFFFSLIFLA